MGGRGLGKWLKIRDAEAGAAGGALPQALNRSMRRRRNRMGTGERATLEPCLRRSRAAAEPATRLTSQNAEVMPHRFRGRDDASQTQSETHSVAHGVDRFPSQLAAPIGPRREC